MPTADCRLLHHGRIMRCLSFLLLLPETLKKRSKKSGTSLPLCYELFSLSLAKRKRMAAELHSTANSNLANQRSTNNTSSTTTTVTAGDKPEKDSPVNRSSATLSSTNSSITPSSSSHHNINNNNLDAPSWACSHPTLRERNALMFNNELMADVHFIVGPSGESRRLPAHKYVLAVGSSVFGAMFYGDLAEESGEIHIPDVEPAAFLILLKYMYSDEIDLDADTVLATLYAAKKYMVAALARACVTFLESSLEARNACVLLSQSRLFEEPELTTRCWEVIDAQALLALRSEGFGDIDRPTLEVILRRETLNAAEAVVFQAALGWAVAECRRRGVSPTPGNKREALGKALYLLRLPTMSLEEFADGAAQAGVLTLEETHAVFLWYTAAVKPQLGFPLAPRAGLAPQHCHRFQSSAYRSNQWRYRGRCDSIQFAADRRVFVAGLGLYGSSGGKAEYGVRIELKRQGTTLATRSTAFVSDGSSGTFPVWFEHPVQVEQDSFYTVSVVLDGNELSYFGQEGMTEVQCGKVTFQFQCSSDSTNGTGVQGGQIPELVFYA
ncbi:BTB/POZ domain-containing protein 6-B-like [Gadus chalcogrammus]|uniref:BTB/POZ domain-containing protein 6-B-like n=1 Tax=Gadus chalcogrammus TaxID=1042646 RepID=UPI0024C266A1|nr:BTB/POZ domain-containing protein 6-B-like [Gadus chalcogrammus]